MKIRDRSNECGLLNIVRTAQEYKNLSSEKQRLQEELKDLESGRTSRHERKTINKQLENIKAIQRRLFLKFCGGIGIIGVIAVASFEIADLLGKDEIKNPKTATRESNDIPLLNIPEGIGIKHLSRIEKMNLSQEENHIQQMLKLQNYWKKIALEALSLFIKADERVGKIMKFMNENGVYTIPISREATSYISMQNNTMSEKPNSSNNPNFFEIVFMPEKFAQFYPSSILTEHDGKTIRIATNFQSKEWLGIMLAHELSHVEDLLLHGENIHNPSEYKKGEVKAHLLEMKLLKFWHENTYQFMVQKGIPLYKKISQGKNADEVIHLIESLYPVSTNEVSLHESALGIASCLTAIAFEEALMEGATEKKLNEVYIQIRNVSRKIVVPAH